LADRSPYGVAVALLIAGLALTGVLLAQAIKAAPAAPVEIGTAATVRVDRTALTVFSSRPGSAPDSCLVTDSAGRPCYPSSPE
jgi:hypothetical protein